MNSYNGSYSEEGVRLCRICSKPKEYLNKSKEWVCKVCRPSKTSERLVPESKICKSCGEEKAFKDFHRDLRNKDGLQTNCRVCYKLNYLENNATVSHKQKLWKSLNKSKLTSYDSKRRAAQRSASPSWLTKAQVQEIQYKYWLAKDLKAVSGEFYEVDHIVPLINPEISGLHVPWNLQILPADLNREKSNRLEIG